MAVTAHSSSQADRKAFTVRPAKDSDAAAIADLGAHTFTASFAYSVEPGELEAYLESAYTTAAIQKDLGDPDRDVIVAVDEADDSKLLGFAYLTRNTTATEPSVSHHTSIAELQRIYVHPAAHGRGVGSALKSRIHQMAAAQGFDKLWLGVWEENHKAISAYESWGYRKVGKHDFAIGPVIQTDHIMLLEQLY
ncbi:acetyltransferase [Microdochium bolleyi]|uniref:Acetyltransferase n=1 Tax=Microdochium bolleyi TaxID=196109 RepID=A0A136JCZ9_9PEZI|nr:acetyltransferase [Microdochium bolleyi]